MGLDYINNFGEVNLCINSSSDVLLHMETGDSLNESPFDHPLRDITNNTGRKACLLAREQTLHGPNGENSRTRHKRPFHEGSGSYDQGKDDIFHLEKAYKDFKGDVGKVSSFMNTKPYDSQSAKGDDDLQEKILVDKLSFRSGSFGKVHRLNCEADDSSTGPGPIFNRESNDSSTESDEMKETFGMDAEHKHHVHSVKEHDVPTFSDDSSFSLSLLNKRKADAESTDGKLQYISMCGSCPCSSCTKAAYMWSDLMYQDTRGQLSALKSSRRHAKMMEGKIQRHENAGETSQAQHKKARSMECDLLQHWTSLFQRTEHSLLKEIEQTQLRLFEIQKLKEKFKRDLEEISTRPQHDLK